MKLALDFCHCIAQRHIQKLVLHSEHSKKGESDARIRASFRTAVRAGSLKSWGKVIPSIQARGSNDATLTMSVCLPSMFSEGQHDSSRRRMGSSERETSEFLADASSA